MGQRKEGKTKGTRKGTTMYYVQGTNSSQKCKHYVLQKCTNKTVLKVLSKMVLKSY